MNLTEKFDTIKNKQYIRELAKSIIVAASVSPCPQLAKEEELLIMISKITDNETANKFKGLYHSQYHAYDFDTYLSLLSELYNLLLLGVTKDKAFELIDKRVKRFYLKNSDILYILDN